MLCKYVSNKKLWNLFILVGVITSIFGVVFEINLPDDAHNLSMLAGMFTGLGGAFAAVGIIRLIRYKRTTPEKLKQEEIELKDERNVQILRISHTVASTTATILFAVMAFVFVWLDYRIPAFISIGAMYIQVLTFFITNKYYNRKM